MFQPSDKVVFRFPQYGANQLKEYLWDESAFQEVLHSDSFRSAILFASPVLYDELQSYLSGKLSFKEKQKVENSLLRYLTRMSTRCTPFGLFASCSVGKTGEETNLIIGNQLNKTTRIDMLYLCSLSQKLSELPEIRKVVNYHINTTHYLRKNKIRYIEYRYLNDKRIFQLVEITLDYYLKAILNEARKGITFDEIASLLLSLDEEIDKDLAEEYVSSIIDSQILVSEIDPIVTGDDFLEHLTTVIKRIDKKPESCEYVLELHKLLNEFNSTTGNDKDSYFFNEIENVVKKINLPYQKKFLLQVDALRQTPEATIGKEVIEKLQDYMTFLNKISPAGDSKNLTDFKNEFSKRYEEREIPLLEVLDPDLGIGFPVNQISDVNPLLEGLALPRRSSQAGGTPATIYPIQAILQNKLFGYNPEKDKEIVIEDKDLESFSAQWNDLPASLGCIFHLEKKEIEDGYFIRSNGFMGASAANLLGRFAYCEEKIKELVNEVVSFESNFYTNFIVAEISHVPDSRVGNILARPQLREYEILYLANSTRNRDELIYPSDILVSVRNNKIFLRSRTLNKYIIPRLTTAHNYRNNPTPIYQFLCEMQSQGHRSGLMFSWGHLGGLPFLPRLRYKDCILSLAQWKIKTEPLKPIIKETNSKELIKKINAWAKELHLPRYISLVDGDNTLFVDLKNDKSIKSFLSLMSKRSQITVEEVINAEDSIVKDKDGNCYSNECVLVFYNQNKKEA